MAAVLLGMWLIIAPALASGVSAFRGSTDPPPSPPGELVEPAYPRPSAIQPPGIPSTARSLPRYPIAPPAPPRELFTEADSPAAVVILAPAMEPEADAALPPSARVFAILRVDSGELPGGAAPAEAAITDALPGRVFEFTALPGTDESLDPQILQLPRVYRVAEVRVARRSETDGRDGRTRPPVRNAAQPISSAENIPAASDPNNPMMAMGFKPISQVTTDTRVATNPEVADELQEPTGEAAGLFAHFGQTWDVPRAGDIGLDPHSFLEPANLCHQPLYFEEVNLERFGTSCAPRLQPVLSGAHFFATVPALPYLMTVQRPGLCYWDGTCYRPGRPAPWHRELPPLQLDAAAVQAAVLTGLIFAIP